MLKRIQRKRTKGWKMPANTVYVGRGSKWGNPFVIGEPIKIDIFEIRKEENILTGSIVIEVDREMAIFLFRKVAVYKDHSELRGKNLACWCSLDRPCHADILLKLANPTISKVQEEK